jgi:hypothetical protein
MVVLSTTMPSMEASSTCFFVTVDYRLLPGRRQLLGKPRSGSPGLGDGGVQIRSPSKGIVFGADAS